MSSSFGGEHMSTAAVPPSMGGDCARANCIPGSPAKSEPNELSHFLERASAFHLIHMSRSTRNQRPSVRWPNGDFLVWWGHLCGWGLVCNHSGQVRDCGDPLFQKVRLCFNLTCLKDKRLITCKSHRLKLLCCAKMLYCILNWNLQLFQRNKEHVLQL